MIKKLLVTLAFSLALFILAGMSYHTEGVTLGRISLSGCVRVSLANKTVTLGCAPVRHNRLYYRLAIQ